eukprot:CCRYP_014153-RB/>CCRYP_014153-RB protein AED:0.32 eAED:0.32 QI:594/0.5/0.66/1/0/0/3/1812/59
MCLNRQFHLLYLRGSAFRCLKTKASVRKRDCFRVQAENSKYPNRGLPKDQSSEHSLDCA